MIISADAIRGYIDIMILSQLSTAPSYAYEMARAIADEAGGEYVIKQTTLYSALKRLETAGQVESFSGESPSGKSRTYYRITPPGQQLFAAKCSEWEQTKLVVDRFVKGTR